MEMTSTRGANARGVTRAAAEPTAKPGCCLVCCMCCCNNCCACWLKPMMKSVLYIMKDDIDDIFDRQLARQGGHGPMGMQMDRDGKVPQAPPLAAFEAWSRNKAAIVIQRKFQHSSAGLIRAMRKTLEAIPESEKLAATKPSAGLDELAGVLTSALGKNVYARAILNAPNEWEEAQMIAAMREVLTYPRTSENVWLLSRPTKFERVLLKLSAGVAKSNIRETRAVMLIQKKFRGRASRLVARVRFDIATLPEGLGEAAARGGLDAIATLVCDKFGKNVWNRAVVNAPNDWEEEQMVFAMKDVLCNPKTSANVWLLATPTKYEKLMMTAFSSQARAYTGKI
jgi:hypothetical protein